MNNKKYLVILTLCLITQTIMCMDPNAHYYVKFNKKEIEISRKGLELANEFAFQLSEYEKAPKTNQSFTFKLNNFLEKSTWAQSVKEEQVRTFVSILDHANLTEQLKQILGKLALQDLFVCIQLADYLGAVEFNKEKLSLIRTDTPKLSVLEILLTEFDRRDLANEIFFDFLEEKGVLWDICNNLKGEAQKKLQEKIQIRYFPDLQHLDQTHRESKKNNMFFGKQPHSFDEMNLLFENKEKNNPKVIYYKEGMTTHIKYEEYQKSDRAHLFMVDKERLASTWADGTIILWNITNGKKLLEFKGPRDTLAILPLSDHEMAIQTKKGTLNKNEDPIYKYSLEIWDTQTKKKKSTLLPSLEISNFYPFGGTWNLHWIALPEQTIAFNVNNQINIFSWKTGKKMKEIDQSGMRITGIRQNTLPQEIFAYWMPPTDSDKPLYLKFMNPFTSQNFTTYTLPYITNRFDKGGFARLIDKNKIIFVAWGSQLNLLYIANLTQQKLDKTLPINFRCNDLIELPDGNILLNDDLVNDDHVLDTTKSDDTAIKKISPLCIGTLNGEFDNILTLLPDGSILKKIYKGINIIEVVNFYENLSFEQAALVKTLRLITMQPDDGSIKPFELTLKQHKKVKKIFQTLPEKIQSLIKKLQWPVTQLQPTIEQFNTLIQQAEKKQLDLFKTEYSNDQKKESLVEINKNLNEALEIIKELEGYNLSQQYLIPLKKKYDDLSQDIKNIAKGLE